MTDVMNAGDDIINNLLTKSYGSRTEEEKKAILNTARPTPNLQIFVREKSQSRSFQISWYATHEWLAGSILKKKLFCWPCLLMSTKKNVWNTDGYSDLKNLSRSSKLHSESVEHYNNIIAFKHLKKNQGSIDLLLSEQRRIYVQQYNERTRMDREILKLLIDVTVILARQELPFRGHDETDYSENRGNFKEIFECILRRETELKHHYLKHVNIFSGMSKTIQNDLIDCVQTVLKQKISSDLMQAPFFALEVDETTDGSRTSQMSLIVRYVNKHGEPVESFLGFYDVNSDRTASGLKDVISNILSPFDWPNKLICQTYDGASVMSGELNGLQAKIKEEAPQAIFMHCNAHKLNLVLKGANSVKEAKIFFSTLSGFPAFFSLSTKCTEVMDNLISMRIPTATAVRWSSLARVTSFIFEERDGLLGVFEEIIQNPQKFDGKTINEATGFLNLLVQFEFIFLLHIYEKIFAITEILFNILQTKIFDTLFCKAEIEKALEKLQKLRNEDTYILIVEEVECLVGGPQKRQRLASEQEDPQRALFYEVLDNITGQLKTRFADIDKQTFFALVDVRKFQTYPEKFPDREFKCLKDIYGKYFNLPVLHNQLQAIYSNELFLCDSLRSLVCKMTSMELSDSFSDAYNLFCLFLSMPATTTSVERSFSCLKRIKSYLRSTMCQERLTGLALISIERKLQSVLEADREKWYSDVIKVFSSKKDRRLQLDYK